MKRKYTEVTCNQCNALIGYYTGDADRRALEDGAIFWKGCHFCDEKCFSAYKSSLRPAAKDSGPRPKLNEDGSVFQCSPIVDGKMFRCEACGCPVFGVPDESKPREYKCNACGAMYAGERYG